MAPCLPWIEVFEEVENAVKPSYGFRTVTIGSYSKNGMSGLIFSKTYHGYTNCES